MKNLCTLVLLCCASVVLAQEPVDLPASILTAALKIKDDGEPLKAPVLKLGKALLKGAIVGYNPEMNGDVTVYVDNPILGRQDEYAITLSDDGTFEGEIPLPVVSSVFFRVRTDKGGVLVQHYFLLSPDEKTEVYIDLPQKDSPDVRALIFAGANAEINNQMFRPEVKHFLKTYESQKAEEIANMSAQAYKTYRMQKTADAIAHIPKLELTRKAADFLKLTIQYKNMRDLMMADYDLQLAYREVNGIAHNGDISGYEKPVFDAAYYSFLKESPVNDPLSFYSRYYRGIVGSSQHMHDNRDYQVSASALSGRVIHDLKNMPALEEEERAVVDFMESELMANWDEERITQMKTAMKHALQNIAEYGEVENLNFSDGMKNNIRKVQASCDDNQSEIHGVYEAYFDVLINLIVGRIMGNEKLNKILEEVDFPMPDAEWAAKEKRFIEKYADEIKSFERREKNEKRDVFVTEVMGADNGLLFDLMETTYLGHQLNNYKPLNEDELAALKKMDNPFFYTYFTEKNNELIAVIEEREKNNMVDVYELPEIADDQMFEELVKPFAGKAVLIDFWESWCGPCRSAMKQFESTKEKYKDKDVVFLYIASESSPKSAWNNMIPNIPGAHYRLTNQQIQYLRRAFGITGVPSYMVLNKKGEQTYFNVGFAGVHAMQNKLEEALVQSE